MPVLIVLATLVLVLALVTGLTARQRLLSCAVLGVCGGAYVLLGAPLQPAQPMSARLTAISDRDPDSLPVQALIALRRTQDRDAPHDPVRKTALGDALVRAGRLDEAAAHYRAALGLDSSYARALRGLADAMTLGANGTVDRSVMQLYRRAVTIDPGDMRSGFMLGVGLWQAGQSDAARSRWDATLALMDSSDPRHQQLTRLRQSIENDQ